MATSSTCPDENCSTLGVDAVSLEPFADVKTNDGELIIYDEENEEAWIQSDTYYHRRGTT
ncbi:hypothetical protein ACFQE8_22690 [Salinirubellus sp. GCM10025818]|uniref:hypothetical protein n=1 Tax=Salinirubellus TaxID=2162630 RepID=UPI0030CCCF53